MLGWSIHISAQTPEEADSDTTGQTDLARWTAGLPGLDWITELVKAGKAEQLSNSGYPCRYTARAGDVLPLLAGGTPSHVRPQDTVSGVWMNSERIAACPADQVLTIDAWDQS
ncbi:hypothetical protein [Streptomyces sp. XH2]|uniref:hypothetical protein n=1 Tax=Streptomyces sp. XH2 TaxID=3412483 RepID=UPI003C7B8BA8